MKPWGKVSLTTADRQKHLILLRLFKPSAILRSFSTGTYDSTKQSAGTSEQKKATGGVIIRPGGRQSTSGLVATVFGCTGLTGRYITNLLARMGTQVVAPYRGDGMNVRDLKLMGDLGQIVPLPFDFYDRQSIERAVARSNVVINLIGTHQETSNWGFHDTHVKASYRLAQVCKEAGVQRFIHVSALGADYEHPSAFLRSKAESEDAVRTFYPDATILRPANIFGPGDRLIQTWIYFFYRKFRKVPIVNRGQSKLQPIYVEDVAKAILHSITTDGHEGKTYHLAGPEIRTWAELIALMQEHNLTLEDNLKVQNYSLKTALLIGKLYETFMIGPNQRGLYNQDTLTQMAYDNVIPDEPDILTLKDLHIHNPTAIFPYMVQIMREQYRDNSPPKLESLDGRDAWYE